MKCPEPVHFVSGLFVSARDESITGLVFLGASPEIVLKIPL